MKINFTSVKEFVAILLFVKSIVACSTDDLLSDTTSTPITKSGTGIPAIPEIFTDSTKNGAIVLSSDPVGNPYNVDTLKKAYQQLYPNGNGQAGMPGFHPTHYQLRFLPADSVEFQTLMSSDIVFTTIPLDKKVSSEGAYYFDPQLEAQNAPYTWQYTIVPVTQELPGVRHEVMAKICAGPNDGSKGRSVDGVSDIWPALETKAYEMCGEEAPPKADNRIGGMPGMPGDHLKRVLVWDDHARQYIPAKGAKVVFWTHTGAERSIVDEYGNYTFSGSSLQRQEIQWSDLKYKWVVYDGKSALLFWGQAIYSCPLVKGAWTYRIKGGKQQTFAVVTRALHRFYYEYNKDLPVPNINFLLRIVCIDGYSKEYGGLFSPGRTIRIWGKDEFGNNYVTSDIFSTTAHELGHLLHYKNIISTTKNWNDTEKIIKESWARCVQWLVTEYEYNRLSDILGRPGQLSFIERETLPNWGIGGPPGQPTTKVYNKPTWNNFQAWPYLNSVFGIDKEYLKYLPYSPLFIDLFDRDNQADYYKAYGIKNNWSKEAYKRYPNDQISDYATAYVISALRSAKTLNQFKENIKNARYNSEANKIKIDTLFNRYIYYWNKYK